MSTPILIVANWKMHKTSVESQDFIDALLKWNVPSTITVMIAPPFTLLTSVAEQVKGRGIGIAAQNMYYEEQGAFTGEISPLQVKDAGATHVIIGHSERRRLFAETDEVVNKKIRAAEQYGLVPIFCVGETKNERDAGKEKEVVKQQIQQGLAKCSKKFLQSIIVAYEPVWAIGTGANATPQQAEEMHAFLKELLPKGCIVLYGGSVKPENAAELLQQPSIGGLLVGGASLEIDLFKRIVRV